MNEDDESVHLPAKACCLTVIMYRYRLPYSKKSIDYALPLCNYFAIQFTKYTMSQLSVLNHQFGYNRLIRKNHNDDDDKDDDEDDDDNDDDDNDDDEDDDNDDDDHDDDHDNDDDDGDEEGEEEASRRVTLKDKTTTTTMTI